MAVLLCIYMKRTTIMLPPDLKSEAIRRARNKGMSMGELIRISLEEHIRRPSGGLSEDTLLSDEAVYAGRAPRDLSMDHDEYLYYEK